jgi:hypothetical protein
MKVKKKNLQNLSEALKTNLRRRKAERKNDEVAKSHQLNHMQKETDDNDSNSNK